jgi:hypothetical protein
VPPHELTAEPNRTEVSARLAAIARRLRWIELLRAAAVAVPVAALVAALLARNGHTAIALGGVVAFLVPGAVVWIRLRRSAWTAAAAARAVEQAVPTSHNLAVTAEELIRFPERAKPWIRSGVYDRAAVILKGLNASHVASLTRPLTAVLIAAVVGVLIVVGLSHPAARALREALGGTVGEPVKAASGALSIVATIVPPEYTGESARSLENPERLDALQGSRLQLHLRGEGSWGVRFGSQTLAPTTEPRGLVVELTLTDSGYIAVEPQGREATASSRRLLPITVVPDRVPSIKIEKPGKDLLLPDAKPVVDLSATASDDFGLQSLELRYTKASGSGERFEFQEGSIPLEISHDSTRAWRARAALAVARLGLEPGDALIYRIVGRDRRPGDAGMATSDTFFIEVAGPGQVALEGFEMPPDKERYALSQQMIVLKLERLKARASGLNRETLEQEIGNIAAEQRAVRANFVFLMGGHVEDEEEEAAHSDEIQEGRLENTARREIMNAILHMGRVEQGLAAFSIADALPPARAAVDALQRAFGRNRYFLRTLPVRSRVDPTRRLTGETSGAVDWKRELAPTAPDAPTQAARDLLRKLIDLAPALRAGSANPADLTTMAEQALAVDASAPEWQAVSKALVQLRDGMTRAPEERSKRLGEALAPVAALTQRGALTPRAANPGDAALRSAWGEEKRK